MEFYVAGCEKLPFESEKVDVMTVCAAYHHFPNVEKFAEEAKRVLQKDGMLYIAEVYLPAFFRVIFNPFVNFQPIMFYIVNTHQLGRTCRFSKKSMKSQLKMEDFK